MILTRKNINDVISGDLFIIKEKLKDYVVLDQHIVLMKAAAGGARYEVIANRNVTIEKWENRSLVFVDSEIVSSEDYHFFIRAMWERPIIIN